MSDEKRTAEPHDRLTRLCDVMIRALEADPEYRKGDQAILFMNDVKRGGIVIHGYTDDLEAIADLFIHLRAMFRAAGKDLMLAPMGRG